MAMMQLIEAEIEFASELKDPATTYAARLAAPVRALLGADGTTWKVAPAGFPPFEVKDIETGRADVRKVTLLATLDRTAVGTFTSPCHATLDASFKLQIRVGTVDIEVSWLDVRLDSAGAHTWQGRQVKGTPIDAKNGQVRLVADGVFRSGSRLGGRRCSIAISTRFQPVPLSVELAGGHFAPLDSPQ